MLWRIVRYADGRCHSKGWPLGDESHVVRLGLAARHAACVKRWTGSFRREYNIRQT